MTISGISASVQALLSNMSDFRTVLDAPPTQDSDFAGYPAAAHYYANTENSVATVSQNRRTIEYTVELYILPDATTTESDLYKEAYALIDKTIQMFDQSQDLSDVALELARACDFLRPVPGELVRINQNEGEGLMMTIRLMCESDVSFYDTALD